MNSEHVHICDEVYKSFLVQKKISQYLTKVGFDVRRWKTLIAVAEHSGSSYMELAKYSHVTWDCCWGHLQSMSQPKEKFPEYPLVKEIQKSDNIPDTRYFIEPSGVLILNELCRLLNETNTLQSDVLFKTEQQWLLNDKDIALVNFSVNDPLTKKELDKFCNTLPEFKLPLECTVSNVVNKSIIVNVYLDQDESLWGMRDVSGEKRFTKLGDSVEVDGERFFQYFKHFHPEITLTKP